MFDHEDYDGYADPQPAEVSGPVADTRAARRVAQTCPSYSFASAECRHVYAAPRTGPPR